MRKLKNIIEIEGVLNANGLYSEKFVIFDPNRNTKKIRYKIGDNSDFWKEIDLDFWSLREYALKIRFVNFK